MILNYSSSTETLTVTFSHIVDNWLNHYLETVRVQINGVTVLNETYTYQPDYNGGSYQYNITAAATDEIKVTLTCNLGGSLSRCILGNNSPCPDGNGER